MTKPIRPLAPTVDGVGNRTGVASGDVAVSASGPARYPLPPLETFLAIEGKRRAYVGPTDESNWVIPGRLMVGAFPGMADDEENERLLGSILDEGITTFVCLQREYDPDAPERLWRSGVAIRPYFSSAVALARRTQPGRELKFLHFGIEDCSVVEDDAVAEFAEALAERLEKTPEVVYLHCWGGHGRAGTVVCLLLHFLYGLDAAQARGRGGGLPNGAFEKRRTFFAGRGAAARGLARVFRGRPSGRRSDD